MFVWRFARSLDDIGKNRPAIASPDAAGARRGNFGGGLRGVSRGFQGVLSGIDVARYSGILLNGGRLVPADSGRRSPFESNQSGFAHIVRIR